MDKPRDELGDELDSWEKKEGRPKFGFWPRTQFQLPKGGHPVTGNRRGCRMHAGRAKSPSEHSQSEAASDDFDQELTSRRISWMSRRELCRYGLHRCSTIDIGSVSEKHAIGDDRDSYGEVLVSLLSEGGRTP